MNDREAAMQAQLTALQAENERLREQSSEATKRDVSKIPCCKCGGEVVEFTIPNDIWNAIVRRNGRETDQEYLCVECFARLAFHRSEDLAMMLRRVVRDCVQAGLIEKANDLLERFGCRSSPLREQSSSTTEQSLSQGWHINTSRRIRIVVSDSVRIRPLSFALHNNPPRADALNYTFFFDEDGDGWRWAVWNRSLPDFHWQECESREAAIEACNKKWRELLEPFFHRQRQL